MSKIVAYNIERYVDGKWIHCRFGGTTKKQALERLKKVAGYKHHQGYDFKITREEYEPEYVGRL